MTWVATAIVGGALITGEANKSAAKSASGARPQFASVLQPGIEQQLGRVEDTSIDTFGGDRVADFTGFQQQGLAQTPGLAQSLQGFANTTGQGFGDIASGSRIGQNPFLEQQLAGMRANVNQNLQQNQLPAIQNNAIAGGGLGGSRQGIAQGLAIQGANRDILQAETAARSGQVNADQQQQLQALLGQQQILQGQGGAQNALLSAGALQQGQDQAEIGGQMQAFNEDQTAQFNRDQDLLSILLGTPAVQGQIPAQTNPLVAGLGAGITTSQLFGGQQQPPPINPLDLTAATNTRQFQGF